jgi:hypothetical protein
MDFPADVAALNHRLRMNRLNSARARGHSTMVPITLLLDRARVEELKGQFVVLVLICGPTYFLVSL